jgi:hypothetical protein
MKEIIERKNNKSLWQWKDTEGRRVYAWTSDRDGVAVEPTGNSMFYSKKIATQVFEGKK